jgi:hypothetical protein
LLQRLIRHAEKIFDLSALLDGVPDRRPPPRTPTAVVLRTAVAMCWARLASLQAREPVRTARFRQRWLGWRTTRADAMGRVPANCGQAGDLLRRRNPDLAARTLTSTLPDPCCHPSNLLVRLTLVSVKCYPDALTKTLIRVSGVSGRPVKIS